MVLRNISMLNFSLPKNSSQELKHKALRSRTATYIVLLRIHVSTLHSHWISMRLLYGVVQKSYPYGFYCCFFLKKVLCQVTGENIGKKGRKIQLSIKKITWHLPTILTNLQLQKLEWQRRTYMSNLNFPWEITNRSKFE